MDQMSKIRETIQFLITNVEVLAAENTTPTDLKIDDKGTATTAERLPSSAQVVWRVKTTTPNRQARVFNNI